MVTEEKTMNGKIETALNYAVFVVLVVAIASIVPIGTCIAAWMVFKAAKNC